MKDEHGEAGALSAGHSSFILLPSSLFNEGHLIDFAKSRSPLGHLLQGRFAEEEHPLVFCCFLDLRGRAAVENHAANAIGKVEKFRDRGAAVETGAVALQDRKSVV